MNNFPCCEDCSNESTRLHSQEEYRSGRERSPCAVQPALRGCTFREVQENYFGNSGEGGVRLWPGSWEGLKDKKAPQLSMWPGRSLS